MQTFSLRIAYFFCTKLQNSFSCRIRQQNPPKSSAQNCKTHFRAEFAGRNRPNLLHKNAKLDFVQNSPAETSQIFCTKTQIPIPCGVRRQKPSKSSAQKFKFQFRAEFRAGGEGAGGGKPLKKWRGHGGGKPLKKGARVRVTSGRSVSAPESWWREASQKGARRRMASQVHRKGAPARVSTPMGCRPKVQIAILI